MIPFKRAMDEKRGPRLLYAYFSKIWGFTVAGLRNKINSTAAFFSPIFRAAHKPKSDLKRRILSRVQDIWNALTKALERPRALKHFKPVS